jgi:hypothetical protein
LGLPTSNTVGVASTAGAGAAGGGAVPTTPGSLDRLTTGL